jgi:hypothetical protein
MLDGFGNRRGIYQTEIAMPASIFLATAAAAALAGCPAPEAPAIDVTNDVLGVEIMRRTPRDMEALYSAAVTFARRVHPVGLTSSDTNVDTIYTFVAVPAAKGQVCLWPKRIQVRLETSSQISVMRELGRNSCEWNAVLEHEMRHVEAERSNAWRYAWVIRDKLRDSAMAYGPFDRADLPQAKARLTASLDNLLAGQTEQMYVARDRAQAAVDTEEEYARVASRCIYPDVYVVNGATSRGALLKNSLPTTTFIRTD